MPRLCLYILGEPPQSVADIHGSYVPWFQRILGEHPDLYVDVRDGQTGQVPEDSFDGYILSGSPASVVEPEPWMEGGREIIRQCLHSQTPLLGVCFGHQLIGDVLGSPVIINDRGWELSSYTIELTQAGKSDPLFQGLPEAFKVNLSHRDVVSGLPSQAVRLAGSAKTHLQAIAVGDHIRGVQFHPEFTGDITKSFIQTRRETLEEAAQAPSDAPEVLLANTADCPYSEQVLHNFVHHFVSPAST